jgi:hypothetical protein
MELILLIAITTVVPLILFWPLWSRSKRLPEESASASLFEGRCGFEQASGWGMRSGFGLPFYRFAAYECFIVVAGFQPRRIDFADLSRVEYVQKWLFSALRLHLRDGRSVILQAQFPAAVVDAIQSGVSAQRR